MFRTIHSGKNWQMSCWVRESQRYFRKSLRTKNLAEAKELATEEYVGIKARLRNGEMIFSKTAKEVVDEYLAEQLKRVRPAGKHQGGITAGRFALVRSALNRHFLRFVGENTRIDKIDPLSFKQYYTERWAAQPSVKTVTLKNERSLIWGLYRYAREKRYVTVDHFPVFDRLPTATQRYASREDSRDAFTPAESARQLRRLLQEHVGSRLATNSVPDKGLYRLTRGTAGKWNVERALDTLIIAQASHNENELQSAAYSGRIEELRAHFRSMGRRFPSTLGGADSVASLKALQQSLRYGAYLAYQAAIGDFPGPTPLFSARKNLPFDVAFSRGGADDSLSKRTDGGRNVPGENPQSR